MVENAYSMPYLSFFYGREADLSHSLFFMAGFAAALLSFTAIVLLYGIVRPEVPAGSSRERAWRIGAVVSILVIAFALGFPLMPGAGSGIPVLAGSVIQFAGFLAFEVFFLLLLLKRRFPSWGLKQFLPLPVLALAAALLPLTGRISAPLALSCFSLAVFVLCLVLLAFSVKTCQDWKPFCFGLFICLFVGLAFVLPSDISGFFWPVALLAYLFLENRFSTDTGKAPFLFLSEGIRETTAKPAEPETGQEAAAAPETAAAPEPPDGQETAGQPVPAGTETEDGAVDVEELEGLDTRYKRANPFIPQEFLAILNKDSVSELELGDHAEQEMTIFFSDIRQFTDLSEQLTPKESFAFINSYLSRIVPEITKNGGFVDKYIGDAILALFPQTDGPDMAVRTAISIQARIQEYNAHRAKCGYRSLSMGIGLHTGTLMVGVVGVKNRMQNTVISDAVNLASRLESITKVFGVSLAISEETFKKLSDPGSYKYRFIGKVRVKGKSDPVSIFEIFDGIDPVLQERKIKANMFFEEGMFHYYQKNYSEALMDFRKVREVLPDDGASAFYMDACLSKIKAL
ncbi:MAG: adenylate/guanylate cyclase domain-containing protein [Treponema sp.]|jgi:two-component system sensor histidine kinase ChiS|nr:adenylate/guanylate cyclase domain-containing protein [Treponema sp.]